jgi:hypothetical protein
MPNRLYLDPNRPYYRGNLHSHSTLSDGRIEPAEVFRIFREAGYHFVALTDHDRYIRIEEYNTDAFLVLPGSERGGMQPDVQKNLGVHLGAIEDPSVDVPRRFAHLEQYAHPLIWEGWETVQWAIDDLKQHGNMVIFNHPEWSMNTFAHLEAVEGYFAVEIYNQDCAYKVHNSYGTAYWDDLLRKGRKVFGVATDDSHTYDEDAAIQDYGGGWVMVQAEKLSHTALATALKNGHFYSSTGPQIHGLWVEANVVHVTCSPCKFIEFKAFEERGQVIFDKNALPLTAAAMPIRPGMNYVRVECVDFNGQVAWSNPIFMDEVQ